MLLSLTFFLCCFVIWRMIWPLKVKWYIKVLLALPLAAGAFKFQCFRVLGGHYFSPDLPGWIILCGAWLYGGFYFIPPMLFCSEAVRFFKFPKNRKYGIMSMPGSLLPLLCSVLWLYGSERQIPG